MREGELEAKRWLRRVREASGLSQAALAEAVETDRRTILNAESEKAGWPNGFTLLRILRELGLVADAPELAPSRLAALEEAVTASADHAAQSLEAIEALLASIDARLPEQGARRREAAR